MLPTTHAPSPQDIERRVRSAGFRLPWWLLALLMGAGAFGLYQWQKPEATAVAFRTEAVARGEIVTRAAATGTLEATRNVTIGAEISGRIDAVLVAENDLVTVGQPLATFDTTTLKSQMRLAQARVQSAAAGVRSAEASHAAARLELERAQTLARGSAIPQAELDARRSSEARARAEVERARAEVEQARATLDETRLKRDKAAIVSPIDGVVLKRNVEPGQTVAASLQAPELFVVAEDLGRMTLRVWVDEADIGVVKEGQSASFDVSAWPEQTFDATVQKLHLSPTKTDNVVTYAALLSVDNAEGLLRPGMTASASIVTGKREDALRVPNAALRFRPPQSNENQGSPLVAGPNMRRWRNTSVSRTTVGGQGTVYVLRGGEPVALDIKTGRSDGRHTEVVEGELREGEQVIVGTARSGKPDGASGGHGGRGGEGGPGGPGRSRRGRDE